jgi:hypothetical protein
LAAICRSTEKRTLNDNATARTGILNSALPNCGRIIDGDHPGATTEISRPASGKPADGRYHALPEGSRQSLGGAPMNDALGLLEFFAMTDLVTPMALRTVATLRIADHLADGPRDLKDLAVAASCDADALGRVLRYLAARGIFVALDDDRFELGGTARWLLDDDPSAARRWLDQDGYGATWTAPTWTCSASSSAADRSRPPTRPAWTRRPPPRTTR